MTEHAAITTEPEWIDPIGGFGDSLLLASVLQDVWRETGRTFGMYRRLPYSAFFRGHPAIVRFGPPPPGVSPIKVNYWAVEQPGPGNSRPYQILARILGAKTPRPETLWVPPDDGARERLAYFPLKDGYVVIAPTSGSPRKMWSWPKWGNLVERLRQTGRQVVQIGHDQDPKVPGTFSLCGYTTPRDDFAVLRSAALAVVVDAFALHAAAAVGTPTVAMWGPTAPEVFGYKQHSNVVTPTACLTSCFGIRDGKIDLSPCDRERGGWFCLADLAVDEVWERAEALL